MYQINHSSFIISLVVLLQGIATAIIAATLFFSLAIIFTQNVSANTKRNHEQTELPLIHSKDKVEQGQLLFKSQQAYRLAPLLKTDVDFKITGMIARVTVKQQFENTTEEWQEGIYVFPLPETAAVDQLRMIIGQRVIEGQIKERKQAKQIYQHAKQQGKKASLVEQERPNIFTNSVANIAPGESISVEIEYQQTIQYDSGEFNLRFPMVVAPRYIPGEHEVTGFAGNGWAINTDQVEDASRITPPVVHPDQENINPVSINVELHTGFKLQQVYSPYHTIKIDESENEIYHVELDNKSTPANHDFQLIWKPDLNQPINAALFSEMDNGNEYALLMMLPEIQQNSEKLQREIIFVIDTSGSMAGESIKQAKAALLLALSRLQTGDRFNVIQFNSFTDSLFNVSEAVSDSSIYTAERYIKNLSADGGTEMLPAMRAALKQYSTAPQVRQVIFLTDGSIGNEDALFALIEKNIADSRLFPVGIGSAPNSHFMNRAARFGRGIFTYIGKTHEVQKKMSELFNKIENPILTDINVDWVDAEHNKNNVEIWPQSIPDIYSGEPILITLRAQKLPEKIRVTGKTAEQDWSTQLKLLGGQQQTGISKLWARRKLASLMDQRIGSDESEAIEKQITQIALEHHLVSKFTSLVAVDVTPSRVKEALLKTHAIPVNLPDGWQYENVFGPLPQTATPAFLHLIIGVLLLSLIYPIKRLTQNHV